MLSNLVVVEVYVDEDLNPISVRPHYDKVIIDVNLMQKLGLMGAPDFCINLSTFGIRSFEELMEMDNLDKFLKDRAEEHFSFLENYV